ncbi:15-hydroxyprostaglandin dehydrogenase [NAD(+)]-like isoform X1 [Harmonia axyridis]|uniref:15-hydroxyprostaglandin dehydrogenase [NAD(+)]-like isoform X1 n=1 Tax=Harmonia axyridis TaxID=115357 RepID=UPI001E275A62|nr:15-hydroxyprostaglandin dehydrogenase [NAD(+)]-like isoform X1 [Harmonia axyridis]
MFEIKGKVALVTGGASGIGLEIAKRLLEEGAKGVSIADINQEIGKKVCNELQKKFGSNKVIFVKTDVSDKSSFEKAFLTTVKTFNGIDILVNNAGIFNDRNYDKEIDVNFKGIVHGITLGIQKYILHYKSGSEGVILNTASLAGTTVHPVVPVYGAIKSAIVSLTMALGDEIHYNRTKVRIVAVAPGFTTTNILPKSGMKSVCLDDDIGQIFEDQFHLLKEQPVEIVGENVMKIIKEKPSGTVWISEDGEDIVEYIPSRPSFKP